MIFEIIITLALIGIIFILARRLPEVIRAKGKQEKSFSAPSVHHEATRFAVPVKKESDLLLFEADRLFAKGNHLQAEKMYLQAAKVDSRNSKIYNRLGAIYLERKNHQDAKEAFREAIRLGGEVASRHFNYAIACFELGEYETARAALKRAIMLDKNNGKYPEFLAKVDKESSAEAEIHR